MLRGERDDNSSLFPPRPHAPHPHVYPGGGLDLYPFEGGVLWIALLGSTTMLKERYVILQGDTLILGARR
jgi:hypothetical protein